MHLKMPAKSFETQACDQSSDHQGSGERSDRYEIQQNQTERFQVCRPMLPNAATSTALGIMDDRRPIHDKFEESTKE